MKAGSPAEQCGLKEGSELLEVSDSGVMCEFLVVDRTQKTWRFVFLLFSWSRLCSAREACC